jgi:hypothetical protein
MMADSSWKRRGLPAFIATTAAISLCLFGQQANATSAKPQPDSLPARQTSVNCGDGIQEIFFTPAQGFDPLTATDAELVANGLPIRPAGTAYMAGWRTLVTHPARRLGPACAERAGEATGSTGWAATGGAAAGHAGTASNETSANWAGYKVDAHTYEDAYGYWTIPNTGIDPPQYAAASSQWIGIGQGNRASRPLVQAGDEADINVGDEGPDYFLWWEVVPEMSIQHVINLGIIGRAGDHMYAHIHLSKNYAYITLTDLTSDATWTYKYTPSKGKTIAPDGTAEWIDERTEDVVFHQYPPLARSTVTFTKAEVSGIDLSKRGVGDVPHHGINMYNCTKPKQELAEALGIAKNKTQFEIKWLRTGHSDPASC